MNGFASYLWDYYFNWLNSCLLVGACWHALPNTPRVILKKACCTASSPNNLKLSSPGNRSVTAQSRDSWSGNSVPFLTVEFWPEAFSAFVDYVSSLLQKGPEIGKGQGISEKLLGDNFEPKEMNRWPDRRLSEKAWIGKNW